MGAYAVPRHSDGMGGADFTLELAVCPILRGRRNLAGEFPQRKRGRDGGARGAAEEAGAGGGRIGVQGSS